MNNALHVIFAGILLAGCERGPDSPKPNGKVSTPEPAPPAVAMPKAAVSKPEPLASRRTTPGPDPSVAPATTPSSPVATVAVPLPTRDAPPNLPSAPNVENSTSAPVAAAASSAEAPTAPNGPIRITSIEPNRFPSGQPTEVKIRGSGLQGAKIRITANKQETYFVQTASTSNGEVVLAKDSELANLPPGVWDVTAVAPDGTTASMPGILAVTEPSPPN